MKYFIISLLFPLFYAVPISDTTSLQWHAERKLTWSDFRAPVPRNPHGMVAETHWSWDWEEAEVKGKYQLIPICYFVTSGSWTTVDDDYILGHEQLHYDIGELYVRKLRKKLQEHPEYLNDSNKLKKVFSKYFESCKTVQTNYDRETNHSINKTKQKYWQAKIKKELDQYKAFDYHVMIN